MKSISRTLLNKRFHVFILLLSSLIFGANVLSASEADKVIDSLGRESGLFVVIGCGDATAPSLATALGKNGNSLVHALARDAKELAHFNKAIAETNVKGCVTAEQLSLSSLPYRNYMVNVMVIMNLDEAKKSGLKMAEARRCMAPFGRLVTCTAGKVTKIIEIPLPETMDTWTHRYRAADGIPRSIDKNFTLPLGFRWNAGLPMNFNNPERGANRYSSTRAMLLDDGRCFTFSTGVFENLGEAWNCDYGQDQYLTCRDAFNGRLLWRKKIGDTYYGGLYIENLAPLISSGKHLYVAGSNGKMLVVNTRTGETTREIATSYIPGVIASVDDTVIVATWKDGKVMGSVKRYDRRRMDWGISEGTIEAYSNTSGALLWKKNLLGTSMLIADGHVYIVNRSQKDDLEKNHNRKKGPLKHPPQKIIALERATGKLLWETSDTAIKFSGNAISLEAAKDGAVVVASGNRKSVVLLAAQTGTVIDAATAKKYKQTFFRYRNRICSPDNRVNDIVLITRRGLIKKGPKGFNFGGARAACLTGTIPAYNSAFIAQNWCGCSSGQIQGILSLGPIGKNLTPAQMETPVKPILTEPYNEQNDKTPDSTWATFRGHAERNSSSPCDIPKTVSVAWSQKAISADVKEGTIKRDWADYLNTRLTAPVVTGEFAIVGDMDHNELIAINLKDGSVAWRFMLAGRMDTTPTLYKGICLVGDHTGYVSAIKVKSGTLIYRLRIAPEEKRMLSYGKVESVWPVVGGVMVFDGKAYASAGRTQGADGGLVIKAFAPETGQHLWAKALPQRGNGVLSIKPTQNDIMARYGELGLLMGHFINLKTGTLVPDPVLTLKNKSYKEAQKKLGRKLKRAEKQALWKKVTQETKTLAQNGRKITHGIEGLHRWNWTRLGNRKFRTIGYGGLNGTTIAWSTHHIATCDIKNQLIILKIAASGKGEAPSSDVKKVIRLPRNWQITSLVICNNAILLGGSVLDTKAGANKGFIQAVHTDGTLLWKQFFAAKLAFNGLAVNAGQILASFDDGTVSLLK